MFALDCFAMLGLVVVARLWVALQQGVGYLPNCCLAQPFLCGILRAVDGSQLVRWVAKRTTSRITASSLIFSCSEWRAPGVQFSSSLAAAYVSILVSTLVPSFALARICSTMIRAIAGNHSMGSIDLSCKCTRY